MSNKEHSLLLTFAPRCDKILIVPAETRMYGVVPLCESPELTHEGPVAEIPQMDALVGHVQQSVVARVVQSEGHDAVVLLNSAEMAEIGNDYYRSNYTWPSTELKRDYRALSG